MMRYGLPMVVIIVALAGCSIFVAPHELPDGAVPLRPVPDTYAGYWTEVEACSGITGPMERIRWFRTEKPIYAYGGTTFVSLGRTDWTKHWITLADTVVRSENAAVIRHEMLHDLLGRRTEDAATHDHPSQYFGMTSKCGLLLSH